MTIATIRAVFYKNILRKTVRVLDTIRFQSNKVVIKKYSEHKKNFALSLPSRKQFYL